MAAIQSPLASLTDKDVEMYSSRSLPVATKAKQQHAAMVTRLQRPWWRTKWQEGEEEGMDDDEKERLESELMMML